MDRDPAQVCLAQDHHTAEALASDRLVLSLPDEDTQFGPWWNDFLPESLDCFDVQERIARAIGNFGEAETFVRIEPLYDRIDSRALRGQRRASKGTRLMRSPTAAGGTAFSS
jgi:hypothetical protein